MYTMHGVLLARVSRSHSTVYGRLIHNEKHVNDGHHVMTGEPFRRQVCHLNPRDTCSMLVATRVVA